MLAARADASRQRDERARARRGGAVRSRANPVATLAALRGVELLAAGDRALGALLCAYAVDSAGYALHHVLGQTTVRVCGTPHAETYAALLPHTMAAMLERAPMQMAELAAAVGATPEALASGSTSWAVARA